MKDINFTQIITSENYKLVLDAILPLKNDDIFIAFIAYTYQILNEKELISFNNYLDGKVKHLNYEAYFLKAFEKNWHHNMDLKFFKNEIHKLNNVSLALQTIENLPLETKDKKELFEHFINFKSYYLDQKSFSEFLTHFYHYDLVIGSDSFWTNDKIKEELLNELVASPKMQEMFINLESYKKSGALRMFCYCENKDNHFQKLLDLNLFDSIKSSFMPSYMSEFNDNFAKFYEHYQISFRHIMKEKIYYLSDFLYAEKFNHSFTIKDRHKNQFLEAVMNFTKNKEKPFDEKDFRKYTLHLKSSSLEILLEYWNYFVHLIEFENKDVPRAQIKIDLTHYLMDGYVLKPKDQKHLESILVDLERELLEETINTQKLDEKNNRLKL
jgi:hypothetical protein